MRITKGDTRRLMSSRKQNKGVDTNRYQDWDRTRATTNTNNGESLGLVVTGGDLCSRGHVFESQYLMLDAHFAHLS